MAGPKSQETTGEPSSSSSATVKGQANAVAKKGKIELDWWCSFVSPPSVKEETVFGEAGRGSIQASKLL
ncbi:MAG: hypothetical protein ABFS45_23655 [Pseudomonadota bacterium]